MVSLFENLFENARFFKESVGFSWILWDFRGFFSGIGRIHEIFQRIFGIFLDFMEFFGIFGGIHKIFQRMFGIFLDFVEFSWILWDSSGYLGDSWDFSKNLWDFRGYFQDYFGMNLITNLI